MSFPFLDDALNSLRRCGRYWNASISRTQVDEFQKVLKSNGFDVIVREIQPEWEHVFYLQGYGSYDELNTIAIDRYNKRELGVKWDDLPT